MTAPAEARGKRPLPVSIIGWLNIVGALILSAFLAFYWMDPEFRSAFLEDDLPTAAYLALYGAWTAIGLAGGVGLLGGLDWARVLLVGGSLALSALGLFIYALDWTVAADLLITLVTAWFLFSAKADAYFGRSYRRP
jgi:hypothetical protein